MRPKGFSSIIILLAMFLLVGAGFLAYQSFQSAWQKGQTNVVSRQLSTPLPGSCTEGTTLEEIPQYSDGDIKISFGKFISKDMEQTVVDVFKNRPINLFKTSKEFGVTSSRIEGDWALLSIGARDENEGVCYSSETRFGCTGSIIAKRTSCENWDMAIIGTDNYRKLVSESPDTFLSKEAKSIFIGESDKQSLQ